MKRKITNPYYARVKREGIHVHFSPPEPDVLSTAEWRERERDLKDARDPRRWAIASIAREPGVLPMLFNVGSDAWTLTKLETATLFKRRVHALAVSKLLRGCRHRVVEVRVDKRRKLDLSSLPQPKVPR